jgi:hypothetical protein
MTTLLVALVLVPIATGLVALVIYLLARPLLVPVLSAVERLRLGRALAHAARCDAQLSAGRLDGALRELEQSFCLMTVRGDPATIDQLAAHHLGLLSRALAIADTAPDGRVRLLAVAKVERLLDRRHAMLRAALQLQGRPAGDARRAQIARELSRNGRGIRAAVRELTADLQLLRERRRVHH